MEIIMIKRTSLHRGKKCLFSLLLTMYVSSVFAIDPVTITGVVTESEKSEPLIGVSVVAKGTGKGVVTDLDGHYSLTFVPEKDSVLTFNYLGYKTVERKWKGKSVINVVMDNRSKDLNEVVVVGYGTQKKGDITGAVSSISKQRIDDMVSTDITQMIQAAVPGLNVMTTAAGADPGDGALMLIRGRNSITASNDPLIVLDGIPYNGSISDINPSDVESISVLKDASAAAIYGSRGANGVILIQTKGGEEGKVKVKYNGFYSIQDVANFPHIMTGDEYYQYKDKWGTATDEVDAEGSSSLSAFERAVYDSGSWKDWTWQDLLLRQGLSTRHNLSISGGTKDTKFNFSAGFLNTKGIVINDNYKRANTRLNLTTNIIKWIRLETSTMLTYADKSGAKPPFVDVFNKSPLVKPFNDDGSINIHPDPTFPNRLNPLECLLYDDLNRTYVASTNNALNFDFPFLTGLSYRLNTGVQYRSQEQDSYMGRNTGKGGVYGGQGQIKDILKYSYTVENILSYKRDFGLHSLFLTGLFSVESNTIKTNTLLGQDFPNDKLSWYGISQAKLVTPTIDYSLANLMSQMFRLNYSYDNRYTFTGTVRRDGYSGFGLDTKWGTFPSAAVGWTVSNEKFFKGATNVMNTLRLRVSYGENGNQAVKPFMSMNTLGNMDYVSGGTMAPGYYINQLGDPLLSWETTRATNIGLDFGFLRSRITGEFNIYRNNTYNLLLDRAVPSPNGVDERYQNIGKTRNEGIEFAVNSTNISIRKFRWTTTANFALIRTQIIDLYGNKQDDIDNKWFIGQPIKVNYDYWITGVWQLDEADLAAIYGAQPGFAKYDDKNNNLQYDPGDRQVIGSPEPNFTWSFINTFTYRQFNLSVFLYGATGMTKLNPFMAKNIFVPKNFWTPDNPTNDYWTKDVSYANQYISGKVFPSVYQNADFARVKDITLTYNFPSKIVQGIKADKLSVYFTTKNPFTFTKWKGMDPELDEQRAIPVQREFILGLNVNF